MKKVNEQEVIKRSLAVKGIKKRCRKIGNHIFKLKSVNPENVDIEKMKALSFQAIKKYMKTVVSAHISLQPQTVTIYDDGTETSVYQYGNDEKIFLEV